MFRINYKPSTSHWIFPPIIMGIILILLVAMAVHRFINCKKQGKTFINKDFRFFKPDADKLRLFGTVVLYVLYVLLMPVLGFLPASILCIFLFNVLYCGFDQLKQVGVAIRERNFFANKGFKSVCLSFLISLIASFFIWFLFAQIFDVTLP